METDNEIYFYRENEKYGYMSNFYPAAFTDNNLLTFNCSEQYFMYQKALTYDPENTELLNKILKEKNPVTIKKLGRSVKNYDEIDWNKKRFNIMVDGLRYKFKQNKNLLQKLIKTKNKTLYEASRYDKIWGIGFSVSDAPNIDKSKYGKNLLGIALMKIRKELSNT